MLIQIVREVLREFVLSAVGASNLAFFHSAMLIIGRTSSVNKRMIGIDIICSITVIVAAPSTELTLI